MYMKNIKYLLSLLVGFFITSSCVDFVEPAIPYNGFETGTYLKTLKAPTSVDFFNLGSSKFEVTLEVHALDKVNNVQEVEVLASHRRGNTVSQERSLGKIPGSAFSTPSGGKWPVASYSVGVSQVLSTIGLLPTNIRGGDFLQYRLILTTTDGKVFSNNNLTGDVSGGVYYASPFFYRTPVVCPSDLGGTYDFESTDMKSAFGACAGTITGKVTLTKQANGTSYAISDPTFGFWPCYGDTPGGNVLLNDACGGLSFSGTDKYGDAYTFTFISNDGTNLVFRWTNASAETGQVTLKANAGKPWPSLLR
jgi:hypothetical protein